MKLVDMEHRTRNKPYLLRHKDGTYQRCWIVYWPLDGTYKKGEWTNYEEPRSLVEVEIGYEDNTINPYREVLPKFIYEPEEVEKV